MSTELWGVIAATRTLRSLTTEPQARLSRRGRGLGSEVGGTEMGTPKREDGIGSKLVGSEWLQRDCGVK